MSKTTAKKFTCILLALFMSVMIAGCWDYDEISEMSMAAGIAIDKGRNGNKYHVTVELMNVWTGGQDGQKPSTMVESDGNSLFEAVRNLVTIVSKEIYFGHCRLILIGEEVAQEGIADIIDLVSRDHEFRLTMDVAIAKGTTAQKILSQKTISNIMDSFEVDAFLFNLDLINSASKQQIYQVSDILVTPGKELTLPALILYHNLDEMTFELSGVAVFENDQLVGYLNHDDAIIFKFAIDDVDGGYLNATISEQYQQYATLEVKKNETRVTPKLDDGQLVFYIETKTCGVLSGYGERKKPFTSEFLNQLENQYSRDLEKSIYDLVEHIQQDLGSDIVGLGQTLRTKRYDLWKEYEDNWDEVFPTVKVVVNSSFDINHGGLQYGQIV